MLCEIHRQFSISGKCPTSGMACRWLRGASRLLHLPSRSLSSTTLATVSQILEHAKRSGKGVQFVHEKEKISEAAGTMVKSRLSSIMVKDTSNRAVGFLTQRDILRCIVDNGKILPGHNEPVGWNVMVSSVMTLAKDLVYLSPEDTIEEARALVSVTGHSQIPVLSGTTVLGVISPKDIARTLHSTSPEVQQQSAKTAYVSTVMSRRGMPLGTRLKAPSKELYQNFALKSAVCNLPHPHKGTDGEDAFLLGPHMVGVADGVGSWWEGGIDPAVYARALMQASLHHCSSLKTEQEFALSLPSKVRLTSGVLGAFWT